MRHKHPMSFKSSEHSNCPRFVAALTASLCLSWHPREMRHAKPRPALCSQTDMFVQTDRSSPSGTLSCRIYDQHKIYDLLKSQGKERSPEFFDPPSCPFYQVGDNTYYDAPTVISQASRQTMQSMVAGSLYITAFDLLSIQSVCLRIASSLCLSPTV